MEVHSLVPARAWRELVVDAPRLICRAGTAHQTCDSLFLGARCPRNLTTVLISNEASQAAGAAQSLPLALPALLKSFINLARPVAAAPGGRECKPRQRDHPT